MSTANDLLKSVQESDSGLTLAELLVRHSDVPRRTAQRWISQLIIDGQISGIGEGRARHYLAVKSVGTKVSAAVQDIFPVYIPLSADSHDILAYIDQPLEARKPVGYQRDFLDAYRPNQTWYLSKPLRRQLRKMGKTAEADAPAGTGSVALTGIQ